jgi:hypothetical protein
MIRQLKIGSERSGKSQGETMRKPASDGTMKAYDTFGNASKERALKIVLRNPSATGGSSKENYP